MYPSSLVITKKDRLLLPELFQHTNVDPRKRTRTQPMRILALGMARTGTLSLRNALEQLGVGPCYHMMSWYSNPRDGELWAQAIEAKFGRRHKESCSSDSESSFSFTRKEWDHLLGDCQAALDAPCAAFMPELIKAYPEAKIILAERDPTKWAKSYRSTIGRSAQDWWLANFLAPLDSYFLRIHVPAVRALFKGMLGSDHLHGSEGGEEEQETIRRYHELHEEVRRLVPKDRILEWDLSQGWAPLAAFLGTNEPKTDFPHINDTETFARRQYLRKWLAVDRIIKGQVQTFARLLLFLLSTLIFTSMYLKM